MAGTVPTATEAPAEWAPAEQPGGLSVAERMEWAECLMEADRRGLIPPDYGQWLTVGRPDMRWDYPHFRHMQAVLDRVTTGELRRVGFQVSVRHGKTEHNTIGYAAYRLERDPTTRIIVGTWGQPQSRRVSRQVKRICKQRGVRLSRDLDTVDEWATEAGGGLVAVGSGSGTASLNADLIIIDDPLSGRDQAESLAHRDRVWDWITDDMLGRAEPHTQMLFSMPRWHPDDPAGRAQDQLNWHWVDLPGEALEGDVLGRKFGALLWPELRPRSWMEEKKVEFGSYGFASLVQCRPRPREGGMFQWEWWLLVAGVPSQGPMVRYWDLAGTKKLTTAHDPDWTAGALLCRMVDQRTAVVDVERFRLSVAARDARMEEVCKADLAKYRGRIVYWIETEAGVQGKERTMLLKRRLQNLGMPTFDEHPTGSKRSRAEPLAAAAEAGNVVLCPGPWRNAFRLESTEFTGDDSGHDDQIDAASGAFAKLSIPIPTISTVSGRI